MNTDDWDLIRLEHCSNGASHESHQWNRYEGDADDIVSYVCDGSHIPGWQWA